MGELFSIHQQHTEKVSAKKSLPAIFNFNEKITYPRMKEKTKFLVKQIIYKFHLSYKPNFVQRHTHLWHVLN